MPPKHKHHHRKHSHSPDHHKGRRRSKSRSPSRSRSPSPHHHGHGKHHHKKHGHKKSFEDQHWKELPKMARKAAKFLGYNKRSWDDDEEVAYDEKTWAELSYDEKRAAHYLGKDPIEGKLDLWWDEVDEETQKYAEVIGWNEKKWDHDKTIRKIECKKWSWGDMSDEQVEAMKYFGMSQSLWDGEGEEEPFKKKKKKKKASSEAPDDESEEEEEVEEEEESEEDEPEPEPEPEPAAKEDGGDGGDAEPAAKPVRKKKKFTQSRYFGGQGGQAFSHGNNSHIDEITVYADDSVINGFSVTYPNKTEKSGNCEGDGKTLKLRPNEYITTINMKLRRVNKKRNVTSIAFHTNRGTSVGPCGGDDGEGYEVNAPDGMVLCGLMGRAGNRIDAVAFRWGSAP